MLTLTEIMKDKNCKPLRAFEPKRFVGYADAYGTDEEHFVFFVEGHPEGLYPEGVTKEEVEQALDYVKSFA